MSIIFYEAYSRLNLKPDITDKDDPKIKHNVSKMVNSLIHDKIVEEKYKRTQCKTCKPYWNELVNTMKRDDMKFHLYMMLDEMLEEPERFKLDSCLEWYEDSEKSIKGQLALIKGIMACPSIYLALYMLSGVQNEEEHKQILKDIGMDI